VTLEVSIVVRLSAIPVLIVFALLPRQTGVERGRAAAGQPRWRAMPARAAYPHRRAVYPYSVIPGGAFSYEEVESAIRSDPVTAAHYAGFDRAHFKMAAADAGRKVYVSFRLGDRIFWTRNAVSLKPGEILLSDGVREARARCGNQISDAPRQPVSDKILSEEVLDAPEDEPMTSRALSQERTPPANGTPAGTAGTGTPLAAPPATPSSEPFQLVPDIFAPADPNGDIGSGDAGSALYQTPVHTVPGMLPGDVRLRSTPPSVVIPPFGPFPVESGVRIPAVVLAVSTVPETWSVSANWREPGVTPPNAELLIRPVPSPDTTEVVFRVSSPVPVAPWWWGTGNLIAAAVISGPVSASIGEFVTGPPGPQFPPTVQNGSFTAPDQIQAVPEPQPAPIVAFMLAAALFYRRRITRRSRP
jgi:hypothetical protein